MSNESLHTSVCAETEIVCDSCGCIVGYYQWIDDKLTKSTNSDKEIEDVLVTYCIKCRMGSN